MAIRIRWSPRAVKNLDDICIYIERDSFHYAADFAKKVFAVIQDLKQFPLSGRVVPEYNDCKIRERILENYRIVYRTQEDVLEIVAICHGSRLFRL